MNYRGIIIRESLIDDSILSDVTILSEKAVRFDDGETWHMAKIQIPALRVHEFREKIQPVIRKDRAWYIHLYHEDPSMDRLIIIFADTHFLASKDINNPQTQKAIQHGISLGIPKEQLDFIPREIAEEKW